MNLRPSRYKQYFKLNALYLFTQPREKVLYATADGMACAIVCEASKLKVSWG